MDVWEQMLRRIKAKISRHAYYSWFPDTKLISDNGTVIVVSVPTAFTSDWLRRHYAVTVGEALSDLHRTDAVVEYVPREETNDENDECPGSVRPVIRRLADVKPEPVKWRWPGGHHGATVTAEAMDVNPVKTGGTLWPGAPTRAPRNR